MSGRTPRSSISASIASGSAAMQTATGSRFLTSFFRMRSASSSELTRKSATPSRMACFCAAASAVAASEAAPAILAATSNARAVDRIRRHRAGSHPVRVPPRVAQKILSRAMQSGRHTPAPLDLRNRKPDSLIDSSVNSNSSGAQRGLRTTRASVRAHSAAERRRQTHRAWQPPAGARESCCPRSCWVPPLRT